MRVRGIIVKCTTYIFQLIKKKVFQNHLIYSWLVSKESFKIFCLKRGSTSKDSKGEIAYSVKRDYALIYLFIHLFFAKIFHFDVP